MDVVNCLKLESNLIFFNPAYRRPMNMLACADSSADTKKANNINFYKSGSGQGGEGDRKSGIKNQ